MIIRPGCDDPCRRSRQSGSKRRLPPSRDLVQELTEALLQENNAHQPIPSELSPTDYGWVLEDTKYNFKWFEECQIPPTITRITVIDDNPAENIESDDVEQSEESEVEEPEEEDNAVIDSSDDYSTVDDLSDEMCL